MARREALVDMANNVHTSLMPTSCALLIGVVLVSLEPALGVNLPLEDWDPESRLWHDIEGQSSQRVRFRILGAQAFPANARFSAVPLWDVSDSRRLFFEVSINARMACQHLFAPVVQGWQHGGCAVEMPKTCVCMLPAVAHVLSNGILKRFEVSAFRRLSQSAPSAVTDLFSQTRAFHGIGAVADDKPIALHAHEFVALATTLQSWLPSLQRGASSQESRKNALTLATCGVLG